MLEGGDLQIVNAISCQDPGRRRHHGSTRVSDQEGTLIRGVNALGDAAAQMPGYTYAVIPHADNLVYDYELDAIGGCMSADDPPDLGNLVALVAVMSTGEDKPGTLRATRQDPTLRQRNLWSCRASERAVSPPAWNASSPVDHLIPARPDRDDRRPY